MDILHALVLSIVEGVTEFLPISSTGHLVLVSQLLAIPQTEFVKSFEIIIQLGAILAVIVLYWKRLVAGIEIWKKIIVAFIPTGIVGLLLYKVVKSVLLGNSLITVAMLFLGGIVLLFVDKWFVKEAKVASIEKLSYKQAALIGLAQSVSIVPGVSRAAATIIGGMGVGMNKTTAVEFSFLLAVPTMAAATGLDLVKSGMHFSSSEFMILGIGFLGAFITAMLAIKFFIKYVSNHSFFAFGVYRIIIAILFLLFVH